MIPSSSPDGYADPTPVPASDNLLPSRSPVPVLTSGDGELRVQWEPIPDATPLTYYQIEYRVDGSEDESFMVGPVVGGGQEPNTVIHDLSNGVSYGVRIQACNDRGCADPSLSVFSMPLGPPGPVRHLQALAGSGQLALRWDPPETVVGRPVTGYDTAYRDVYTDAWRAGPYADQPYATITGLQNGIGYAARVRAESDVGPGPWVTTSAMAVTGYPQAPVGVRVAPVINGLAVTWAQQPQDWGGLKPGGYIVSYRTLGGGDWLNHHYGPSRGANNIVALPTTITLTGLVAGAPYEVRMAAYNSNGQGPWSEVVDGTPAWQPVVEDAG